MSTTQLIEFEHKLQGLLAELSGAVKNRVDLAAERSSDPLDDLQRKEEVNLTARSRSTLWGRQKQIELALERLGTGGYGICEDCGEPISPKRLEAAPWARLCVFCQQALETEAAAAYAAQYFARRVA